MTCDPTRRELLRGAALSATALILPATVRGQTPPGSQADSPDPAQRFFAAVARGDLEAVRGLLDARASLLQARDDAGRSGFAIALLRRHAAVADFLRTRGHTPDLHEAALALDWEVFAPLAAAHPDQLNAAHPIGGSAMAAAALGGAGTDIWRIYQHGGEPDARPPVGGRPGHSPLLAAFAHPDLATAELTAATLLANGADPNPQAAGETSPLHAAAERGSAELVEMLIRKGADAEAADGGNDRPLDVAERRAADAAGPDREAAAAVLRMLQHHAEIPRDHQAGRRAFDASGATYEAPDLSHLPYSRRGPVVGAAHFDLDRVRAAVTEEPLLAHAVATTTEGAVEAAAHTGRQPIVDLLLEHGAPCSIVTAASRNDQARVRALLRDDPRRVHERGPHDFALLWYPAIGAGSTALAELLLAAGADIERQHHLGATGLHFAALADDRELAALLLERGADINRVARKFDPTGQTPLALARARGREGVARLLEERGGR